MQLAEKIRQVVEGYRFAEAGTITISLGAAEFNPGETLDGWFRRVDQALFQAKTDGRNTGRLSALPIS